MYAESKLKRISRYKGEDYGNDAKRHEEIIEIFATEDTLAYNTDVFDLPTDIRHINNITYNGKPIDKVTRREIFDLQLSLLTQPSELFPVYTQSATSIKVFPDTIISDVNIDYIRQPLTPKWTWVSLSGGEPIFNQGANDYQDFELPEDDFVDLTMKILQYCGVTIREAEVASYANNEEQENKQ
jgi:hypothetical protein